VGRKTTDNHDTRLISTVLFRRLFQRQGAFFLNLEGGSEGPAKDASQPTVDTPLPSPTQALPPTVKSPSQAAPANTPAKAKAPTRTDDRNASPPAAAKPSVPIDPAAALRAEAANRPQPVMVTFAPQYLSPATALPRKRRTSGAALGGFKAMARELGRGS